MANTQRNFISGIMNKSLDERLLPNGQYVDALNVRLGSTEETEVGSVENTKGNIALTSLEYDGTPLSSSARCIGAYEDGGNETIYWFIHDNGFVTSPTNILDLIVSLNVQTNTLTYHVISISNPTASATTLSFNPKYLITGVNLVDQKLLFFTDNINPPRFINVERNYGNPVANVDGFSAESLLVIKKPPITSPSLNLLPPTSQNNFLEDRFVCFGYRYQYADGEFSATSQFSEAAFIAKPFDYDFGVGLNDGMLNAINTADITYNSGGPLVTAVELLWKDMTNGNIRAIEKLNKAQLAIADDTEYTYRFEDSKIFTVLPSSEILRLYDNVPRLAQAQTLMGNRLIYGNYLEQYDLITPSGGPVQLNYTASLNSTIVGLETVETSTAVTLYSVFGIQTSVINGRAIFDNIGSFDLKAGASIEFEINFEHNSFAGVIPTQTNGLNTLSFVFILPRDYSSAFDLASSQEFIDRIGTINNIKTVANSCDGDTMTDVFNCSLNQTLDNLTKSESGVTAVNQPIQIIAQPGQDYIGFTLLAMVYELNPNSGDTIEYYKIQSLSGTYQTVGDTKSLHSNRNYEVGIIYMDDFNRATTALVSQYNTQFVPCENAESKNQIQIDIPTTQVAPAWATRYKFCIKQDKEDYFNVYSSFFVTDPTTAATYFLLEGQNAQKVEEGDILQVKSDTDGPLRRCAFATVLEKKSQIAEFLNPPPVVPGSNPPIDIPVPTGVYMKMRANDFATEFTENAVINYGQKSSSGDGCRQIYYPCFVTDSAGVDTAYTVPAGSKIKIKIDNYRRGNEDIAFGNVPQKKWFVDTDFTSTSDYDSLQAWFEGDNIAAALSAQAITDGTGVTGPNYDNTGNLGACSTASISCTFIGGLGTLRFVVKSSEGYNGSRKETRLRVRIEVIRATGFIAWETKPTDAVPDVWYISPDSYPLAPANTCEYNLQVDTAEPNAIEFDYTDIYGKPATVNVGSGQSVTGVIGICNTMVTSPSTPPVNPANITIDSFVIPQGGHIGNVQTQFGGVGGTNPAIINTAFFNCFAFGNGIESYQIRDEIAGKELTLGNQVTSTSAQEYKEVHRFADLTYSGVFNDESNLNKLNEFNLGLLNFKPLEEEFGNVMKLDGRETDVLCLQEDKISYILAGKNLLSDATGGGAVTSVPEVLGTQIARIEEYGISFNPESYAKWGSNKFFTDAKRGAVIQLKGSSAQNEQLSVISEAGMRSWFRDLFIDSFNTQKLGGYDPYMNEYVLSSNNNLLPEIVECIDCGITRTLNVSAGNAANFCADVGNSVGAVIVTWNVLGGSGDDFEVETIYNGVVQTSGATAASGTISVNKNVVTPEKVNVFISMVNTGNVSLEVTVACPDANSITIIQVCISKNENAGEFIHNEYNWNDGVIQSPTQSVGVQLAAGQSNPLVSQYSSVTGLQGSIAPPNGSTVRIISNQIPPTDNFVFDPAEDNFRYLRSNTLYVNTPGNIANLLTASNNATPITGGGGIYRANFLMPNTSDEYLYLIYDYRNAEEVELCFDAFTSFAACCECGAFSENYIVKQCRADSLNVQYIVSIAFGLQVGDFCELQGFGDCVFEVIGTSPDPTTATISQASVGVTDCNLLCYTYGVANNLAQAATMTYLDCSGVQQSINVSSGNSTTVCLRRILTLTGNLTITLDECGCSGGGNLVFYDVQQCRQDGAVVTETIQDLSNSLNVGNLIEISNNPSCVWEITNISQGPATETVVGEVFLRACTSICQKYSLTNTSSTQFVTVDYSDCNNQAASIIVAPNTSSLVCALQFVSLDPKITLQLNSCVCP